MSRQADAKKKQGYMGKPLSNRCRTCKKVVSRIRKDNYGYKHESLFCGVGDFKVQANAKCELFAKNV